tara:strand:+ start:1008 stop:1721 length:714 start_codon:yes stop_codon:yes gene_type:complete
MSDGTHYVYLRLGSAKENDLTVNTVALKAETVSVSTTKTVPSFNVPLSGMFSGESRTVALNLGMASKTVSIQGQITDQTIIRKFDEIEAKFFDKDKLPEESNLTIGQMNPPLVNNQITIDMTKEEVAQLLHSNTDGTTFQEMQNMDELIILIPSKVDSRYQYRNSDRTTNLIPFTYAARGHDNTLDNSGAVVFVSDFPDSTTAKGMTGFVRSFSCDFSGEAAGSIGFSLEFEIALTV